MQRNLSITFALLAVASAAWLLVSGLIPPSHEKNPGVVAPVILQGNRLPAADATHHRLSTARESGLVQGHGPRTASTKKLVVSSPPPSTARNLVAVGLPSPSARHSPPIHPSRLSPAANQIRPTVVSEELTHAKSSANSEEQTPSKTSLEEVTSVNPGVTTPIASQPAVWVDLGEASPLSQEKQDEIQALAESLSREITESGLDPASPEYRQAWEKAVVDSDQLFRQRYGGQAWMEHHIHAYHLAHSTGK